MAKGKYQEWLRSEKLVLLRGWAQDGLTDNQIAKNMGIAKSTMNDWKDKYPEIAEALKKGKEVSDYEVENALYKKCIGYWATEEVAVKCKEVYYDESGHRCEREEIKVKEIQKYVTPDTTAQLAWLNNRRSDKWRRNAGKEKLDEKRFQHDKDIDGKKYF